MAPRPKRARAGPATRVGSPYVTPPLIRYGGGPSEAAGNNSRSRGTTALRKIVSGETPVEGGPTSCACVGDARQDPPILRFFSVTVTVGKLLMIHGTRTESPRKGPATRRSTEYGLRHTLDCQPSGAGQSVDKSRRPALGASDQAPNPQLGQIVHATTKSLGDTVAKRRQRRLRRCPAATSAP